MKIVADKLSEIALQSDLDHEIDLFGRSAFNRYYYAAYLAVRKNLMEIKPEWAKAPHKNLPKILTSSINELAKRIAFNQKKKGSLTASEKSQIVTSIKTCGEQLSRILQRGDEARIYADYFPEKMVKRTPDDLSLHNCTLHEARSWPIHAERRAGQLLFSWRQLG
jgi:hypothetical protein